MGKIPMYVSCPLPRSGGRIPVRENGRCDAWLVMRCCPWMRAKEPWTLPSGLWLARMGSDGVDAPVLLHSLEELEL